MTAGFGLDLGAGDVKKYRGQIKHLADTGNLEICFFLTATGSFPTQGSSVGINGICP